MLRPVVVVVVGTGVGVDVWPLVILGAAVVVVEG